MFYILVLFGGTVGGFMHRHGNLKDFFLWLYCNNSILFQSFRVLVSGCSTSAGTCTKSLLCFRASLSLYISFLIFFFFLNHSFSVVSARSWYHSSACNHNSLIMFIDFNIKIIKPLAPLLDSWMFNWSVQLCECWFWMYSFLQDVFTCQEHKSPVQLFTPVTHNTYTYDMRILQTTLPEASR